MGALGEKYINSFLAYDKEGNTYKINVFKSIIDCGNAQDPKATRLGLSRLCTENGLAVNLVDKEGGEFLIVQTNTSIHMNRSNPD